MLTSAQINAAANAKAAFTAKFLQAINDTCTKFNINTPIRQLCFLAQVGHESGGLFFTEELASGKAYEGRKDLGNTQKGDGVKFKGRGLIQITGRANYTKLSKFLVVDLVSNPTLLGGKNVTTCTPEQIKNAALSAGWFWDTRKINALADKMDIKKDILTDATTRAQFIAITKKINGGTNGLQDRVQRYLKGLPLFS
jgi:putative chitinase